MYNASADFKNLIKADERLFDYYGSIVTTGNDTYDFTFDDIRSAKIVRSICTEKLEVGSVYASELDCDLMLSVSRYELYGGVITLNTELDGASDVIPMGYYNISEVNQSMDRVQIKAYDNMIKFEAVPFVPKDHTEIQNPYAWISAACTACGVTFGNTRTEIALMPNGRRLMGYADVSADVKTWRDALSYIVAVLGGYAYIGRDGKLYIGQYKGTEDDTISEDHRYTSNLSDYKTTYNGLYSVYKEEASQEYVSNTNPDGLVLDLGTNPFMQYTVSFSRSEAMKEILNVWQGLYYVPFTSNMPANPLYDPGDVLKFTGNQASNDIGVITEIVYTIGNQMSVTCTGENPRLAAAQDRFTKTIAGLSSEYSNTRNIGNRDFWIISTSNTTEALTVSGTEVQVAEIEWQQNTYAQDIDMILSIDAELSATAVVNVRIIIDDDAEMEFPIISEKVLKGTRPFHGSNPHTVIGVGTHTAKVFMTVTDSPLLWGDLV